MNEMKFKKKYLHRNVLAKSKRKKKKKKEEKSESINVIAEVVGSFAHVSTNSCGARGEEKERKKASR